LNWFFLTFAFTAGVLMAVQGTINGLLGKFIGVLEGNFLVHAIGLTAVSILLFVFQIGKGDWSRIGEVPWYGYTGGLLSVAIIYGVMAAIPKIGAANATAAIIVGQVGAAMLLDLFGLFGLEKVPWSWWRLLGIILLATGGKLMLHK